MRRVTCALVCAVVLGLAPVPISGQWPSFPSRRVPRLPDGTVDMNAPAPRTADGRPDLSGIWENVGRGPGQQEPERLGPDEIPFASFFDVGAGFRDGLPLQPWAAALKKERSAANSKDNPDAWCLPLGNMQFNVHPFPRKIVQAPHVIVIMYETHQGYRQIFMDGRTLPDNDPQPWWFGYSVGRWEGDTLVVETTHFRDGEWLDIAGSPLTDAARTIERFRRPTVGQLDIEITFDDPKAYTRPFTVRLRQRLMPDTEIIEMVCHENNQFPQHVVD